MANKFEDQKRTCDECGHELITSAGKFGVIDTCTKCGLWWDEQDEQHEIVRVEIDMTKEEKPDCFLVYMTKKHAEQFSGDEEDRETDFVYYLKGQDPLDIIEFAEDWRRKY